MNSSFGEHVLYTEKQLNVMGAHTNQTSVILVSSPNGKNALFPYAGIIKA